MKLYTYYRSSASYRVRIAMALKGLSYDPTFIHLARNGGEQNTPEFHQVNPQGFVPVLIDDEGNSLYQSLAIMEYLDETHPNPPLLPKSPAERARVRSLALAVACEIHPLNNPRVLNYLTGTMGVNEQQKLVWIKHWIELGLGQFEKRLAREQGTGRFCHGDTPTMADCSLVPQVFNAQRFECDLSQMPIIQRINDACMQLDAFQTAHPSKQPDAA
jgi:maleylacetoacetate isomerase